jgi:hypothetical protein
MDKLQAAKDLMANDLFNNAIDDMKSVMYQDWLNTTEHETASREQLWLKIKLAEKLRGEIVSIIENDTIANHITSLKEI